MNRRSLTNVERRDWLRLSRAENVGPITFRHLLARFGNARAALEALPDMAQRGGKRAFKLPAPMIIEAEMGRAAKIGAKIIAQCEPGYPEVLAALEDAPPLITVLGQVSLLHKRAIGIVGARNASLNGRKMAETLARELGKEGIAIVSGLARGIDTSAHQGGLGTGTVAALAGGVDVVYPEENRALYSQMAETGCILSDMPIGCEPHAKLFSRRNRLISGLSLGVIVVEAALQSGSLLTAHMALEQGREVFAVPGSPLDPRCAGSNDLIRQGAVLTEKASDILDQIHTLPNRIAVPPSAENETLGAPVDEVELTAARGVIIENLGASSVTVDELIYACAFSPAVVLTVLLELELAGYIDRQAGQRVALIDQYPLAKEA